MGDRWAIEQLQQAGVQATSIKVYLCALKSLLKYLRVRRLQNVDETFLAPAIETVGNYMSSLRGDVNERHNEYKELESETIDELIPKLKAYSISQAARVVIKMMGNVAESVPTAAQFADIRAHMIVTVLINNGQRSGALLNCTLDQFASGKHIESCFIMKVAEHKTSTSHGYARLTISEQEFRHLKSYVTLRNRLITDAGTKDHRFLFPDIAGGKMSVKLFNCYIRILLNTKRVTATW